MDQFFEEVISMMNKFNDQLRVDFAGVNFKNPIILSSGTAGFGQELNDVYNIELLGGLSTKGLTLRQRSGNVGTRIWETPAGIMNSIGLENPGIRKFIEQELDFLEKIDLVNIVNIGGSTLEDYIETVKIVSELKVDMIELNISCPNLKKGGMSFGIKAKTAAKITREIRKITDLPLVVKLSPQARNISEVALACQGAGADGLSLVNTFKAMAIDIEAKKPVFENIYAGLSGPAIKPIALRMVHEVCQAVEIPVMGVGGISSWQDAVEYIMAGASLVQIGTANFINPRAGLEILKGLNNYFEKNKIESINQIRGII